MPLLEYYNTTYTNDLNSLQLSYPSHIILEAPEEFGIDAETVFFGGENWKHIKTDLASIEVENYTPFVLCLFADVTIDMTLYTHYRSIYNVYRQHHKVLKFGWVGMGPIIENPRKLIAAAEHEGLLLLQSVVPFLQELTTLFINLSDTALQYSTNTNVTPTDIISTLLQDPDFQVEDTGMENDSVFGAIYSALHEVCIE